MVTEREQVGHERGLAILASARHKRSGKACQNLEEVEEELRRCMEKLFRGREGERRKWL